MSKMLDESIFETEIQEYLELKSRGTKNVYIPAFRAFLDFYQKKYGEGKGFSHFLDRIFDELKKPRREQKRIAETELMEYIDHLKQLGRANNSIRSYFGGIQNLLKYKGGLTIILSKEQGERLFTVIKYELRDMLGITFSDVIFLISNT